MRKYLAIALCVLLFAQWADAKPAGSSYSSGGRSSFSGSSSGRSSYSSSGSSGRSSYSSGGKSSGSSSSKPVSHSGSTTYSSGGSTSKPKPVVSPSGTTYSSGSKPQKITGVSAVKSTSTYDSRAVQAHKTVESRAAYKASFAPSASPKTEYKTSSGTTAKIDPKDKQIQSLRSELNQERWSNRETRIQTYYGGYYLHPMPIVHYSDPYNPFFWMWLTDRSIDERAYWVYNHRSSMDEQRYRDMIAKDANLEARIRELEHKNVQPDSSYVPKGMDRDLMYSDNYVDAAFNPERPSHWFRNIVIVITLISIGVVIYFVVFVHRF